MHAIHDVMEMTMGMKLWAVFLGAIVGGTVQSITGFGCGVLMMIFMPIFFPLLQASAITSALCISLTVSLAVRYRRLVNWKILLLPGSVYLIFCNLTIWISTYLETRNLMLAFGVFLIALALYCSISKNHLIFRPTPVTAVIVSTISGISGGLFGIGGPLMAPYFLSTTKSKEEYIGTIQTLFAFSTVIGLGMRIARGIYTASLLPATLFGMAGVLIGRRLGAAILDKIDIAMMMRLIYIMIGLSGVLTVIST